MSSDKSPLVPTMNPPPPSYTEASKGVGGPTPPAYGPTPPAYGATGGQSTTSNVTVVIGAPQPVPVARRQLPMAPINTFLVWSIITTIFFSLPIGLIAIIYSLKASNAYEAGVYNEALAAARTAKILNIVGMIVGITVDIVLIVIIAAITV